ncbi:hypothetical protein [Pseudoalteromonas sp. P1-25]|uniref:hypothetical protein n=1 Tax=Pseudoalteromonas sp. P1-25 TaxID=1723758 RepID=UPI0006D6547A|nr:hypothetical protein [Pseudoalteromonas sp. P1-25]KPZ53783.1 hypothetical protein AN393_02558 [Pseudoalteromonas sp. P1-25]
MTGRFNLDGITNPLQGMQIPEYTSANTPVPDNRSRVERREDFEKDLSSLDKKALIKLKEQIIDLGKYDSGQSELWKHKDDIENSLIKLIRYIDKFEDLNSDESRKVALKEQELKLEAKHDWAEKFRLFFFRVLATGLFISSLFIMGYIEHNYDWARLPLSKYIKTVPIEPGK